MKAPFLIIINGLLVGVISATITYVGKHDLSSAQIIISQLVGGGAGISIIITTAALINHARR